MQPHGVRWCALRGSAGREMKNIESHAKQPGGTTSAGPSASRFIFGFSSSHFVTDFTTERMQVDGSHPSVLAAHRFLSVSSISNFYGCDDAAAGRARHSKLLSGCEGEGIGGNVSLRAPQPIDNSSSLSARSRKRNNHVKPTGDALLV